MCNQLVHLYITVILHEMLSCSICHVEILNVQKWRLLLYPFVIKNLFAINLFVCIIYNLRVVFVVFLCLCFQDLIILILTKFISLVEIYRHWEKAHQFTKGLVTLRVMIGYRGGRQVITQVNVNKRTSYVQHSCNH